MSTPRRILSPEERDARVRKILERYLRLSTRADNMKALEKACGTSRPNIRRVLEQMGVAENRVVIPQEKQWR